MSQPAEIPVDDPPAVPEPRRPTAADATDIIGRRLNGAHAHARDTRAGARALDAAGETQRAIAAHAAADAKEWEAACLEAGLARLQAMEPYDDEIRVWIRDRRARDAKAAAPARPRRSAGRPL